MQLAHAADDRLSTIRIGVNLEGRILLGEPLQADAELVLVGLRLGLDGQADDGAGLWRSLNWTAGGRFC